jgi:hypothetical protein
MKSVISLFYFLGFFLLSESRKQQKDEQLGGEDFMVQTCEDESSFNMTKSGGDKFTLFLFFKIVL